MTAKTDTKVLARVAAIVAVQLRKMVTEFGDPDDISWSEQRVRVLWAAKGFALDFVFTDEQIIPTLFMFPSVPNAESNATIAKTLMNEAKSLFGGEGGNMA